MFVELGRVCRAIPLQPFSYAYVDDVCILLVQQSNGVYTVGDFMTRKENLHVVKPTTSVDEGTPPS